MNEEKKTRVLACSIQAGVLALRLSYDESGGFRKTVNLCPRKIVIRSKIKKVSLVAIFLFIFVIRPFDYMFSLGMNIKVSKFFCFTWRNLNLFLKFEFVNARCNLDIKKPNEMIKNIAVITVLTQFKLLREGQLITNFIKELIWNEYHLKLYKHFNKI